MIYKITFSCDEVDGFRRVFEADSDATFLELHTAILKSVNFPDDQMTSFFICDEDWEKETWNLENLQNAIVSHKRIKPTREQLKKDLYYLTKTEITKKYDYPDRKDINKLAKEYNLFCVIITWLLRLLLSIALSLQITNTIIYILRN